MLDKSQLQTGIPKRWERSVSCDCSGFQAEVTPWTTAQAAEPPQSTAILLS